MHFIVKNTTFIDPLDLLAPHSCRGCGRIGSVLCDRCKNYIISNHQNLCPICKTTNLTGKCNHCKTLPPTFIVSPRSAIIGTLIHDLKYNSVRALAKPLAEILSATVPPIKGPVSIVPLPTISKHIRARGLDHTYLIAKNFAKLYHNYQVEPCLIRAKNTIQVGSSRKERLSQATEAYELSHHTIINPKTTYILLDDVWTTGASMQSALKKLRQAGAKNVIIALLAVSELN